jgi:F0F1-type ATP synthase assembly protein I
MAAAFELVMTPALFGCGGFLLDRLIGTTPVFTLVLSVLVLCYVVWKMLVQYMADSDAELERWRAVRATAGRAND